MCSDRERTVDLDEVASLPAASARGDWSQDMPIASAHFALMGQKIVSREEPWTGGPNPAKDLSLPRLSLETFMFMTFNLIEPSGSASAASKTAPTAEEKRLLAS